MPQSLSSILIHLVFSTKLREPLITPMVEPQLYAYISAIFRERKSPSILIGGTADHIHALFCLSRTTSLADLVEDVKKSSSKWIKMKGREFHNFQWQSSYGAFSIGQSSVPDLKRYISTQKEHHHRIRFQDEVRLLLKKYNVKYDEKYLWE